MIEQYYRPQALEFYRKNMEHPPDAIPSHRLRMAVGALIVLVTLSASAMFAFARLPRLVTVQVDCSSRLITGLGRPAFAGDIRLKLGDGSVEIRLDPAGVGHHFEVKPPLSAGAQAALQCATPVSTKALLP